jgi:hypothetical protein
MSSGILMFGRVLYESLNETYRLTRASSFIYANMILSPQLEPLLELKCT